MQRGAALMAGMAIGLLANRVFYAPWPLFHRAIGEGSADDSLMPFLLNCHAADAADAAVLDFSCKSFPQSLQPLRAPGRPQKFHDTTACPRPPTPVDCILDLATKFYEYFTCEDLHDQKYEGYYSLNVDLCFSL